MSGLDWTAWLEQRVPSLLLYARQLTASIADAEDAVQEGVASFWPRREQTRDPAALLYTCVRSAAANLRRSQWRRSRREHRVATESIHWFVPATDDGWGQMVTSALSQLEPQQRQVLVMKIWGALTFVQIGQVLDIPMNTAASRYRLALEQLRRNVGPEWKP